LLKKVLNNSTKERFNDGVVNVVERYFMYNVYIITIILAIIITVVYGFWFGYALNYQKENNKTNRSSFLGYNFDYCYMENEIRES
jgi:uncharacterized membrane protein YraQ (UPF0718 family)